MLQQQLSVESGRVVTLADLTLKMKKPYQFDSENEATDIPQWPCACCRVSRERLQYQNFQKYW